jgi:hypothetical protein
MLAMIAKAVQKQIKKAGDFPVPDRVMEVKAPGNGVPAIAVILIPTEGLGGLETLCIKAFSDASKTNQQLVECQKIYFDCGPSKPKNWGVEKRDKAAFQCLVAASCKDNPSMSTAWVFSTRQRHEPVIGYAMPKIGYENPDDHYTEEETARRLEAALRGSRVTGHTAMKDMIPKRPKTQRKPRKKATTST